MRLLRFPPPSWPGWARRCFAETVACASAPKQRRDCSAVCTPIDNPIPGLLAPAVDALAAKAEMGRSSLARVRAGLAVALVAAGVDVLAPQGSVAASSLGCVRTRRVLAQVAAAWRRRPGQLPWRLLPQAFSKTRHAVST